MRRITVTMAALALLAGLAGALPAEAGHDRGEDVECPKGKLVIDVTQHFINGIAYESYYADPVNVDVWAKEDARKRTRLWQVGADAKGPLYCAEVTYQGSFVTVAGHSPADRSIPLAAGIRGDVDGRYVTNNFHGTLDPHPDWKARGNLGKIDFQCDPSTGDCPGYVSWQDVYFVTEPADWDFLTYDFEYYTRRHGTFVQHLLSFEGNITN